MYNDLLDSGYGGIQLVGIGKSTHIDYLDNWTSDSDVGVCADVSPYSTWEDWGAAQRDLFILNNQGDVEFHENISSGFNEQELSDLIISLMPETATCDEIEELYNFYHSDSYTECLQNSDCHIEDGACGSGLGDCYYSVNDSYDQNAVDDVVDQWINQDCMEWVCDCLWPPAAICDDGMCEMSYCIEENPAGCSQTGCEEGYECIDYANYGGDCIPSSCWCDEFSGGWFCTEDCNGGACYPMQTLGDINNDTQINVLDVVLLVGFILGNEAPDDLQYISSDVNTDGNLNVLDVVLLVGVILGN